jgi:hypothetical protein
MVPGEIALRSSGISNLHPIRTAAWISARRCAVVFKFVTRMVKELDLFESNHGCGLNARSQGKHPKRT